MKRLSKRFIVIALCALMTLVFASCTQPDNNPAGQQPEEEKPLISNDYFYGDWEVWQENSSTHELEKLEHMSVKISKDDFQMLNGDSVFFSLKSIADDPYATMVDLFVSFGYTAKMDNHDGTYSYSGLHVDIEEDNVLGCRMRQNSKYSSWEPNDSQRTDYTLKRIGEGPVVE